MTVDDPTVPPVVAVFFGMMNVRSNAATTATKQI
jgi:hypothetical protein